MDRKIVEQLILKKSFNEIERDFPVGKKRIKKVHELATALGYLDDKPLPPYPESIFDPPAPGVSAPVSIPDQILLEHKEWIKERLELGWSQVTIIEELPVKVGASSFYRIMKRHKLNERKTILRVIPEIIHAPGESLILDWGKLCDVIDPETGKKRTLWFLSGIMGHSRYMMVRLVWDNKLSTTLSGILNSDRAINVNISIMRIFTKLRSFHALETSLTGEVKELKENSNKLFKVVFERLDSIEDDLIPRLPNRRKRIGINSDEPTGGHNL